MNSFDVDQCIGLSAISITSLLAGYFTDTLKHLGEQIAESDAKFWRSPPKIYALGLTLLASVSAAGVVVLVLAIENGSATGISVDFIRYSVAGSVGFLLSSVAGATYTATTAARIKARELESVERLAETKLNIQELHNELSVAQLQLQRDLYKLEWEHGRAEQDARLRRARFVLDLPGVRRLVQTFAVTRRWATEVLLPWPHRPTSQPTQSAESERHGAPPD